ncbi:MAG: amidohydrolase [Massilimaliae sp.]|nr:amidohydrolase [Massiliimalia sp.]
MMSQTILQRAMNGDSFEDLEIIDVHCHMGNFACFQFSEAGIDPMIEDAKRMGVAKICVVAQAGTSNAYQRGNMDTLQAAERYPEHVLGYVALNPHKPEEAEREIKAYYPYRQFVGVKIHPGAMQAKANCEGYRRIFELVRQYGGYVLVHTWEACPYSNIDLCEDIIKDFPDVNFVLGHSGGTVDGVKKAIHLANRFSHVYLDCCGFDVTEHALPEMVEQMRDPERLLYGSDYPFHDLRYGLTRVLFSDLDDDMKQKILSANAQTLLDRSQKR